VVAGAACVLAACVLAACVLAACVLAACVLAACGARLAPWGLPLGAARPPESGPDITGRTGVPASGAGLYWGQTPYEIARE
jgi:hypothetical protein